MKLSDKDINDIRIGTNEVSKVYLGDILVWAKSTEYIYTNGKDLNIKTTYPIPTTTYDADYNETKTITYLSSELNIPSANTDYSTDNVLYTPTLTTYELDTNMTALQVDKSYSDTYVYNNITYHGSYMHNVKNYWDYLLTKCVGKSGTVNCYTENTSDFYQYCNNNSPTFIPIEVSGLEPNTKYKATIGFSTKSSSYSSTSAGYWNYLICSDNEGQNIIINSGDIKQPYGNYGVCRSGTVEFTTPNNSGTVFVYILVNRDGNRSDQYPPGFCQFSFEKSSTHYNEALLLNVERTIMPDNMDDIMIQLYPTGYGPSGNVLYTLKIDTSGNVTDIQKIPQNK